MVEEPSENVGHVQGNPPDKPDQNTTKERKLRRRLFWPVIRIAVIAYATWIIGLYYYQDGMIFPVDAAGEPCAKPFDENVEILRRPLEEGGKAEAWYFPGGYGGDVPRDGVCGFAAGVSRLRAERR